jgi:hypothetical protein
MIKKLVRISFMRCGLGCLSKVINVKLMTQYLDVKSVKNTDHSQKPQQKLL